MEETTVITVLTKPLTDLVPDGVHECAQCGSRSGKWLDQGNMYPDWVCASCGSDEMEEIDGCEWCGEDDWDCECHDEEEEC